MDTKLTEGNPLSVILKFMLPLMVGNIFQQLYNFVDTIIVGRFVGPGALAAVGSTGTVMFFIIGTTTGMVMGFTVITSQKYGSGDEDAVKKSFTNGIYLSLAHIVLSTLVMVLAIRGILVLMNTPDDIFDDAYSYISIICWGIFATAFYNYFSSILRAIGNSLIPLISLLISAGLNVCLDLLFIIVFKLGTAGAAYATVLSQAVSALFCIVYIYLKVGVLRPGKKHWRLSGTIIRGELMQGIPMALQTGITASGTMIMQSAFNMFGSIAVAGVTGASKLQILITQAMFTAGQTMSAYVGQNFGKRDFARIRKGVTACMKIFIIYSVAAALLTTLLLPVVLPIFFESGTDISIYLPWARIYIIESAVCYFFLAMIFVYRSTIQSIGHSFAAMIMGGAELVARVIMSGISMIVASFYLAAGADAFAWVVAAVTGIIIYRILLPKTEKRIMEAAAKEEARLEAKRLSGEL